MSSIETGKGRLEGRHTLIIVVVVARGVAVCREKDCEDDRYRGSKLSRYVTLSGYVTPLSHCFLSDFYPEF